MINDLGSYTKACKLELQDKTIFAKREYLKLIENRRCVSSSLLGYARCCVNLGLRDELISYLSDYLLKHEYKCIEIKAIASCYFIADDVNESIKIFADYFSKHKFIDYLTIDFIAYIVQQLFFKLLQKKPKKN